MKSRNLRQDGTLRELLEVELEAEREAAQSAWLSPFRRNASCWELLLTIAATDGATEQGIYQTLKGLETPYLGQSAMVKFVKECRKSELLLFDKHIKRSATRIQLAPEVQADLVTMLERRNRSLRRLHSCADEGYQGGAGTNKALLSRVKK